MYLFFDTETTGLPANWRAPVSDSNNWPRLVQLSWAWFDNEGRKWDFYDNIIYPDGFYIPEESTKIHRISHEVAKKEGKDLKEVMELFSNDIKKAEYVVAHNISFDEKIVGAELYRLGMDDVMEKANKICTMKSSVDFCKISNNRGSYKWPNLSELHRSLFGEDFTDAHNALVDVFACARCFFALKKKNHKF